MRVISVKHPAEVIVGDYQIHYNVSREVRSLCAKGLASIPPDDSNVKASVHTAWDWEPDNITFRNLKEYIREEIERYFKPGAYSAGSRAKLDCKNFWANVYEKGDYAQSHNHKPWDFSFAYFVKSKWYDSPLVFSDSGKRIRPKEGRFIAFPAYLNHHVPKHRYNNTRITLSGNLLIDR